MAVAESAATTMCRDAPKAAKATTGSSYYFVKPERLYLSFYFKYYLLIGNACN